MTEALQQCREADAVSDELRWISEQTFANLLGVTVRTIQRWTSDDPSFPVAVRYSDKVVRYRLSAIRSWMQARESVALEAKRLNLLKGLNQIDFENLYLGNGRLPELTEAQKREIYL